MTPGLVLPPTRGRDAGQQVRLAGLRLIGRLYGRRGAVDPPRSILLIRPDHLGDVLFLTPALHALREALPAARLTLLAGPWSREVVAGNTDLDEVRLCAFPGFERRPKAGALAPYQTLDATARALAVGGYDAAVVLRFDHWWGAWLAAAAGIRRRIGFDWPETRPFLTQPLPYAPGRHAVEDNATLLAALAPPAPASSGRPGPLRYRVRAEDEAWVAGWLAQHGAATGSAEHPLVAIHVGAGAAVKQWEPAAWAAVAGRLARDHGAQIVLTGGPGERELAQAVADGVNQPAINAAGETTFGQLAALLAACRLVIGSDSGPLHLAVAVGAATVHLYGPADPNIFGPWGEPERHVVLMSDWTCAPCGRFDWPADALPLHRCMAAISPAAVLSAAGRLLAQA